MRTTTLGALALLSALGLAGCGDATDPDAPYIGEPTAPAGMKYVGAGGIVMAVPEAWAHVDPPKCPYAEVASSYRLVERPPIDPSDDDEEALEASAAQFERNCADIVSDPLAADHLTVTVGRFGRVVLTACTRRSCDDPAPPETTTTEIAGLTVERYDDCGPVCYADFTISDRDVTFTVVVDRSEGTAFLDELEQSIVALPPEWTTSEDDGTVRPAR